MRASSLFDCAKILLPCGHAACGAFATLQRSPLPAILMLFRHADMLMRFAARYACAIRHFCSLYALRHIYILMAQNECQPAASPAADARFNTTDRLLP